MNPAGGNWTDDSSWSLGSPPGNINDAVFNLGATSGYSVSIASQTVAQDILVDTDKVTINLGNDLLAVVYEPNPGGYIDVGAAAGQSGSLVVTSAVSASELFIDKEMIVGQGGGTGSATLSNINVSYDYGADPLGILVGSGVGSVGTLAVTTGTTGNLFAGSLMVGESGGMGTASFNNGEIEIGAADVGGGGGGSSGTVTLTNRGALVCGEISVGSASGSTGSISMDGSGISANVYLRIGNMGSGTVTMTDNSGTTGASTYIGMAGGSGEMTASMGSQLAVNLLVVGDGGTGTCTFSGGSEIQDDITAYVGGNGGNGTVHLSGKGTTWTDQAFQSPKAVVGANSSGQAGTGMIQLDTGAAWKIAGTVTVDAGGTLNVLSGATLTVTNLGLSHGGTTNFTGGNIVLTGGTVTDANFSLPNTATLAGTGTLSGNLTSDGVVSPGDAPGILTVDGSYVQNADGTLDIGLGGTIAGTQYDQFAVMGSASLAGTLDVTLLGTFGPQIGYSFDLFTAASEIGAFGNIDLPTLGTGLTWDTSDLYASGVITVMPEPAALGLAAGLVLMLGRRSDRGPIRLRRFRPTVIGTTIPRIRQDFG